MYQILDLYRCVYEELLAVPVMKVRLLRRAWPLRHCLAAARGERGALTDVHQQPEVSANFLAATPLTSVGPPSKVPPSPACQGKKSCCIRTPSPP